MNRPLPAGRPTPSAVAGDRPFRLLPRRTASSILAAAAVHFAALGFGVGARADPGPEPIDAAKAQAIALAAAGCDAGRDCVIKGGLTEGQWVFIVSFVHSRDADGKPRFMPGGLVGVTVSRDGRIVDLMPGA
jgi:hypothetical protein